MLAHVPATHAVALQQRHKVGHDGDNPASYTNEIGQTTLFVFDNSNRKVQEQDPPPNPNQPSVRPTLTWSYDTRGNMVKSVDALGRATSYVYGQGSDGDDPDLDQMIQPDPAGGTNYTITNYGHDKQLASCVSVRAQTFAFMFEELARTEAANGG